MWQFILDKAVALVVGLAGVFVGARLTRSAQDRQFARQQAAQRVDRARAAYQDGVVLGHRLQHMLRPTGPEGTTLPDPGEDTLKATDELIDICLKLKGNGANDVAEPLMLVAGLGRLLFTMAVRQESTPPEHYVDLWTQMANGEGATDKAWERWQAAQEAVWSHRPSHWRWPRNSSRAQLPEHDPPDGHR